MRAYYSQYTSTTSPFLHKILLFLAVTAPSLLIAESFCSLFAIPGPLSFCVLNSSSPLWLNAFQLFSYPIAFSYPGEEIGVFWLLRLSFSLYLLWMTGGAIIEQKGQRCFALIYAISTLVAGAAALFFAKTLSVPLIFSGPFPFLLSILLFWTMLSPELTIWIFFFFPVKAKWGVLFFIVLTLLQTQMAAECVLYLSSLLFTWIYALAAYDLNLPFPALRPVEEWLENFFSMFFFSKNAQKKVVSFRSLQSTRHDEEFIDRMLEKVSVQGENSLSLYERWRMRRISRKKFR